MVMALSDVALASINIPYKKINTLTIPAETLRDKNFLRKANNKSPSIERWSPDIAIICAIPFS